MNCSKCQKEIHPLRIKILPNTRVCVKYSKTGAYKGVITTHGTGDHTWNDLAILTSDQAEALARAEEQYKNTKFGDAES